LHQPTNDRSQIHRCDNIRDCTSGEDEEDCKFCNYDEFKCLSDQKCISEKWQCDGSLDCADGSDEANCDSVESDEAYDEYEEEQHGSAEDVRIFYDDIRDFNEPSSIDHSDSDGDKIISTGDDVVPIFINPNSTLISDDLQAAANSSSGNLSFIYCVQLLYYPHGLGSFLHSIGKI
jgi:hypothetical protein